MDDTLGLWVIGYWLLVIEGVLVIDSTFPGKSGSNNGSKNGSYVLRTGQ